MDHYKSVALSDRDFWDAVVLAMLRNNRPSDACDWANIILRNRQNKFGETK